MKLINIGFGNMVNADRLVAAVSPESAPIKRIVQEAKERGAAIDATYGRRTQGCSSWIRTMWCFRPSRRKSCWPVPRTAKTPPMGSDF